MDQQFQEYWFAWRASQWAYVAGLISNSRVWGSEVELLQQIQTQLYGGQVCANALYHLRKCLDHLNQPIGSDPELLKHVRTFRRAYSKCRVDGLRHALEHEEEKISGRNLKGKKPYNGELPSPHSAAFHGPTGRFYKMQVLDEKYDIEEAIEAGAVLNEPLGRLARRLWRGEVTG